MTFQFERAAVIGKSDHDVIFSGKENSSVMTKHVFNVNEDRKEEMFLESPGLQYVSLILSELFRWRLPHPLYKPLVYVHAKNLCMLFAMYFVESAWNLHKAHPSRSSFEFPGIA